MYGQHPNMTAARTLCPT